MSEEREPYDAPPPAVVADLAARGFTDIAVVGRGGFGVVYRAEQRSLGRTVAVKMLAARLDPAARERFAREGRALGRLAGHPNIVPVHDVGTTAAGLPFLVMAYVPGGSLAAATDAGRALDAADVVRIGIRLCGALETAHRNGIVHRDVKPDNILLSAYGEPLLADFGIARMTDAFETASRVVTASVEHAAPEILDGAPPSVASDVYALGSTLHTLLAGAAPFARTGDELLAAWYVRIARQDPPDLTAWGVPALVARAVAWGLEKDPDDRPRTASAFGEALRDAAAACGWPPAVMAVGERVHDDATPPSTAGAVTAESAPNDVVAATPARRRGRAAVLAVATVAALVAVAAAWLVHDRAGASHASAPPTTAAITVMALGHDALVRTTTLARGATFDLAFTVTDGQRLTGTVQAATAPSSAVPVAVVDPNGSPMAETSLRAGQVPIDPVGVLTTGVHRLRIGPAPEAMQLRVEVVLAPDDVVLSTALDGAPLHVALTSPRQRALVTVTAPAGAHVQVRWTWTGPSDPRYAVLGVLGADPPVTWSPLGDDVSPPIGVGPGGSFVVAVVLEGDAVGSGDLRVTAS